MTLYLPSSKQRSILVRNFSIMPGTAMDPINRDTLLGKVNPSYAHTQNRRLNSLEPKSLLTRQIGGSPEYELSPHVNKDRISGDAVTRLNYS
jgi:hypothetical protein